MTERKRAPKGTGTIGRFHEASKGCPPAKLGGGRPDHDCKALYRARITVKNAYGEPIRKTVYGKTHEEVQRKQRQLVTSEGNGRVVTKSATVADWFEEWLVKDIARNKSRNTLLNYERWYRIQIKPYLGHLRLDKLKPEHVSTWHDELAEAGYGGATIHGAHAVLRRGIRMAIRKGLVVVNVADSDHVEQPAQNSKGNKPLSVRNAWKVIEACDGQPRFILALMAALRRSEALSLRWMDLCLSGEDCELCELVGAEEEVRVGSSRSSTLFGTASPRSTTRGARPSGWLARRTSCSSPPPGTSSTRPPTPVGGGPSWRGQESRTSGRTQRATPVQLSLRAPRFRLGSWPRSWATPMSR
jgi:hypothetical protein